jgi:hypothetical protein
MLKVRAAECQDEVALTSFQIPAVKSSAFAGMLQIETARIGSTLGPLTGFQWKRYVDLDNSERLWPKPGGRGVYRLGTRP